MLKTLRLEKKEETKQNKKVKWCQCFKSTDYKVGVAMFVTPMFLIKYLMLSKKVIASLFTFFLLLGIKDSYFLHGHLVVHFEVL